MRRKRLLDFILHIFFSGWTTSISIGSLVSIVGFLIVPRNPTIKQSVYIPIIFISILVFVFICKILKQYYSIFDLEKKKPKALRIINGTGLYKDKTLIIFSNDVEVEKDELLTMFSDSSGTRQPVCLLQVVDVSDKEIITEQYPYELPNIMHYFEEDSRRKSTYFLTGISSDMLEYQISNWRENE